MEATRNPSGHNNLEPHNKARLHDSPSTKYIPNEPRPQLPGDDQRPRIGWRPRGELPRGTIPIHPALGPLGLDNSHCPVGGKVVFFVGFAVAFFLLLFFLDLLLHFIFFLFFPAKATGRVALLASPRPGPLVATSLLADHAWSRMYPITSHFKPR